MAAHSDALVFFGITGDLAYKKIFPALHAMIRRKTLDIPIIGVARDDFTLGKLKERARASIDEHGGGVDPAAIGVLDGLHPTASVRVRGRTSVKVGPRRRLTRHR
jgi:glucose-6-phosphate 1-dehydrogenase